MLNILAFCTAISTSAALLSFKINCREWLMLFTISLEFRNQYLDYSSGDWYAVISLKNAIASVDIFAIIIPQIYFLQRRARANLINPIDNCKMSVITSPRRDVTITCAYECMQLRATWQLNHLEFHGCSSKHRAKVPAFHACVTIHYSGEILVKIVDDTWPMERVPTIYHSFELLRSISITGQTEPLAEVEIPNH